MPCSGGWGARAPLWGVEVERAFEALAWPHTALRLEAGDALVYAHDRASPWAGRLLHLDAPRAVLFEGWTLPDPLARAELASLRGLPGLAPLPSLQRALESTGFEQVLALPPAIEPSSVASPELRRIAIAPHPGAEREAAALARELHAAISGLEVVTLGEGEPDPAALKGCALVVSLDERLRLDPVLLRALAEGVPAVAYGQPAARELLGGAGLCFDEKRFAAIAEVCAELLSRPRLAERLRDGQRRRADALSPARAEAALAQALDRLGGKRAKRRTASRRPRVALVVQRYGEVTGGAEKHAKEIAEHLAPHWELTVLTSCARDHLTWENTFAPGETREGSVRVLRFPTVRTRRMASFNARSRALFSRPRSRLDAEGWIAEQGPLCPGLDAHLEREQEQYDGFVGFTYLYAPTVFGLAQVAPRALLVPTAHDEPALGLVPYRDLFERCAALLCNTPEEAALIERQFPNHARTRVVGVGIDRPRSLSAKRFRERHRVDGPYLLYVGRIERGKGIDELLRFFETVRRERGLTLLLAGEASMAIRAEGVRLLGRIDEQDKWDALAGAEAVVVPSRFESLSLLTLEAFAAGTPVIASAHSEVLRGQIARSRAGFTYAGREQFAAALDQVRTERGALGRRGTAFAQKHDWATVVDIYREELARIWRRR